MSELLFRDKAKSTLLSINGALIGQMVTWDKRPYWLTHLPRVRILEDYINKLTFIYEDN